MIRLLTLHRIYQLVCRSHNEQLSAHIASWSPILRSFHILYIHTLVWPANWIHLVRCYSWPLFVALGRRGSIHNLWDSLDSQLNKILGVPVGEAQSIGCCSWSFRLKFQNQMSTLITKFDSFIFSKNNKRVLSIAFVYICT